MIDTLDTVLLVSSNANLELILLEMVKPIMLIVWIKLYFILYINLIIFLLILKLLDMTGVFILNVEKKKLNLKHEML